MIEYETRIACSVAYTTVDGARARGAANNGYYIGKELEHWYREVSYIRPLPKVNPTVLVEGAKKAVLKPTGRSRPVFVQPNVMARRAQHVLRQAESSGADFVFSNGPIQVAGIGERLPYAFISDTPVIGLVEMGSYFNSWDQDSVSAFLALDILAVQDASVVFYHSRWAADLVIERYRADPSKIHVVSPGANLDYVPVESARTDVADATSCELLFYGRDWERKGGDIAVEVVRTLRRQGIPARLIVCGPPSPPAACGITDFVLYEPPIDKDMEVDRERFAQLCRNASFLLLPTRSDASAGAVREAAAYALPAVTRAVGGMGELVTDGIEGLVIPPEAGPDYIAERLAPLLRDPLWRSLFRIAARRNYEDRLNWRTAMDYMAQVMHDRGLGTHTMDDREPSIN